MQYCDYEIKRGNIKSEETIQRVRSIWLRAVEQVPYCVVGMNID